MTLTKKQQEMMSRINSISAVAFYVCRKQAEDPAEDGQVALDHLSNLLEFQRKQLTEIFAIIDPERYGPIIPDPEWVAENGLTSFLDAQKEKSQQPA